MTATMTVCTIKQACSLKIFLPVILCFSFVSYILMAGIDVKVQQKETKMSHIKSLVDIHHVSLARAFLPWKSKSKNSWCTFHGTKLPHDKSGHITGLAYVKNPKAASTTTSGVALHIAHRYAARMDTNSDKSAFQKCDVKADHLHRGAGVVYEHRNKDRSFLFSTVRNPAKRAISRVFYQASLTNESHHLGTRNNPNDTFVLKELCKDNIQVGAVSPGKGGFQLAYLSMKPIEEYSCWSESNPNFIINQSLVHALVKDVIDEYDFLLVVERLDESLVVMQLLLELHVDNILYMSAKTGGGYSPGKCTKLPKSYVSPKVAKYMSSEEWYAKNYGDYLLHAAANKSLDMTIDQLGREIFSKALENFRLVKALANEKCINVTFFPCSENGVSQKKLSNQHCYKRDWGCGYPCFNELNYTNLLIP